MFTTANNVLLVNKCCSTEHLSCGSLTSGHFRRVASGPHISTSKCKTAILQHLLMTKHLSKFISQWPGCNESNSDCCSMITFACNCIVHSIQSFVLVQTFLWNILVMRVMRQIFQHLTQVTHQQLHRPVKKSLSVLFSPTLKLLWLRFLSLTLRGLLFRYHCFGWKYYLYQSILSWNTEAPGSCKMLVPVYQNMWHHIQQDCRPTLI
jgi:hypothetical protein